MKNKIKMNKQSNLLGKIGDLSLILNFTYNESNPSDRYDTDHLSKSPNFDNGMAPFDQTTVEFIQKLHFHRNVLKFILVFISSFDDKLPQ